MNTLYVARKMKLAREMYFAILLDRSSAGPIMIGCSEGGTSIEDLAEKFPEKIIKIPVDARVGISQAQAEQMATGLAVTGDVSEAAEQIKRLYELFVKSDCTMVEVRPLRQSLQTGKTLSNQRGHSASGHLLAGMLAQHHHSHTLGCQGPPRGSCECTL